MNGVMYLLLFLSLISIVSGVSPSLVLDENVTFQPYETVIGYISGNQTKAVSEGDLKFFYGRREVSLEGGVAFYNNTNYFYFKFNREGNFTVKINNILYDDGGKLGSKNLEREFLVGYLDKFDNETNSTYHEVLEISPGVLENENFIWIKNRGTRKLNVSSPNGDITLEKDEIKQLEFGVGSAFDFVNLGTYRTFHVPIIYKNFKGEITREENENISLKTNSLGVEVKIYEGNSKEESITLYNFAESPLENIKVKHGLKILDVELVEEIPAKGMAETVLFFYSEKEGFYSDTLEISYTIGDKYESLKIPVSAFIFAKNATEAEIISSLSCEENGGEYCSSGEYCKDENNTSDNFCCFGSCEKLKGSGGSGGGIWGTIIGLIILVGLGFGGFSVWKKFKNVKGKEDKIKTAK